MTYFPCFFDFCLQEHSFTSVDHIRQAQRYPHLIWGVLSLSSCLLGLPAVR